MTTTAMVSADVGRARHEFAAVVVAVALALLLLLPGIGAAPFDDPGEGQHAEIAREILASGDWLTLRLNGVRYFDKPPLLYWLTAGSFSVLGAEQWAARLAPLAGAVAAAAATAVLGARLLGPLYGIASAGALLSSALFLVFGRYLRPETLFVGAIAWAFTGLLLALCDDVHARQRRRWLVVGAAGLALASIAKDPLGLLGPVGAVAGALVLAGRRPTGRWRFPWSAAGVALIAGFGWYVVAAALNPGFAWYAIVDNHLLNLLRLRHFPDEDIPLSGLEFLAVTALGVFPWIIAALLQMASLVRRRAWRERDELPWMALSLWSAGLILFFAAAPFKLPHYGLPAYPAIALLAVRYWKEHAGQARRLMAIHLACFAALGGAAALAASSDGRAFTDAVFSSTDVYTRKELAAGQSSPLPPWSELAPLVRRAALVLGAGSLALSLALVWPVPRAGLLVVLATMLGLMPMVTAGSALVASRRAVAGLAGDVARAIGPDDLLVHEGPIENSGALEFYSGRRPVLLDARRSVLGIGATFPDAAATFWDADALASAWRSDRRVFLVTPRTPANSVVAQLPAASAHLLAVANGRWLYSNRPASAAAARRR